MNVLKTEDWHEDDGDCLFFHFDNFEQPPEVICGTPMDSIFKKDYWTHFIKGFDFNELFDQAEELNKPERA